jgi:general secretion pathway protein K
MKNTLLNNRGVALILVLLMISIIIAITIQLTITTRSELYESANLRDSIKLLYIAKSGFNMGEALLYEDDNDVDSPHDDWAKMVLLSAQSSILFDKGHFQLNIVDESGKIQINELIANNEYNDTMKEMLLQLLNLPEFNLEEPEARDIVDAIKDWIDEDDETTEFGAENAYYQGLEEPYLCKNGKLDCLEELLMIKGITKGLFYGTDESPGIAGFLTLHGEGKININTASTVILRVLNPEITEEMASDMDEYRKNEDNNLTDISWYKNVTGMATLSIDPALITTKSNVFKIVSTGYFDNMTKTVTGMVDRTNADAIKILSWRVD